ncbi:LysR family transcriptional regulator [Leucobacter sp. M11]|uniref:LysR family transcriptional regulator n=1 Tax=Leucobacter sp. M11 TaxID=2993565 RepID=UPI002D80601B|nr:LysR family transcriptional regulator [Leucobacter sp. M11]MEB4614940.1 LysR family transcriptional regulator [Leucobacter sp. M11]
MDLNLLRVFAAVYETGTVTEAATRLHMAQPSVTQALNRLRREAGDPLFVRQGRRITPTRAARQLYAEVGDMPAAAEAAVRGLTAFVPETTQETFRLALTDLGQTLFLPMLAPALMQIAPKCKLDIVNLEASTAPEELRSGAIDLAVSSTLLAADLRTSVIRDDVYCCIARRGRFAGRTPTLDELTSVPRVVVKGSIGHTLVEQGLPAPVEGSLYLPAFSSIPALLAASNLIAFVPRGVVHLWAGPWDLVDWPLPPGRFTSSVRAHLAPFPLSSASAWFTDWAISMLRLVPEEAP